MKLEGLVASLLSHSVAALGIGMCFNRPQLSQKVLFVGVACTVLPDLDVIGFRLGVHYGDFWGHRGFTHSLVFAAMVATFFTIAMFRTDSEEPLGLGPVALWSYLFLATGSHGLLDAMTDGGLGVAFFSPFDDTRYFLPWRPIAVSPIGLTRFFTQRGWAVLKTEFLWIWIPSAPLGGCAWLLGRKSAQSVSTV
jgi:inner membrane protein